MRRKMTDKEYEILLSMKRLSGVETAWLSPTRIGVEAGQERRDASSWVCGSTDKLSYWELLEHDQTGSAYRLTNKGFSIAKSCEATGKTRTKR